MRLLQKLTGLEWMGFTFQDTAKGNRIWSKGYQKHPLQREVLHRFMMGLPLSCFGTKTGGEELHVAYSDGDRFGVKYLTFAYNTSRMFIKEMGVHFCQFHIVEEGAHTKVTDDTRDRLLDKIDCYALMLPFMKNNQNFQYHFTLVYHNWDVLVCNDCDKEKGFYAVDRTLFPEEYLQGLI